MSKTVILKVAISSMLLVLAIALAPWPGRPLATFADVRVPTITNVTISRSSLDIVSPRTLPPELEENNDKNPTQGQNGAHGASGQGGDTVTTGDETPTTHVVNNGPTNTSNTNNN